MRISAAVIGEIFWRLETHALTKLTWTQPCSDQYLNKTWASRIFTKASTWMSKFLTDPLTLRSRSLFAVACEVKWVWSHQIQRKYVCSASRQLLRPTALKEHCKRRRLMIWLEALGSWDAWSGCRCYRLCLSSSSTSNTTFRSMYKKTTSWRRLKKLSKYCPLRIRNVTTRRRVPLQSVTMKCSTNLPKCCLSTSLGTILLTCFFTKASWPTSAKTKQANKETIPTYNKRILNSKLTKTNLFKKKLSNRWQTRLLFWQIQLQSWAKNLHNYRLAGLLIPRLKQKLTLIQIAKVTMSNPSWTLTSKTPAKVWHHGFQAGENHSVLALTKILERKKS